MATLKQCSRESTALHVDYYSTAKETANPFNEWWMARMRVEHARSQQTTLAGALLQAIERHAVGGRAFAKRIEESRVRRAFLASHSKCQSGNIATLESLIAPACAPIE